ncbi:unnamed protein product [Onchocerca ochengi]|uniref:Cytochrome P450 n=1 Tax=Onchocerca ochengi TaxID=42157 RepID=A0A182EE68_ONCOC|nr:unnamed protein product [Onchocerca ochengi]
MSTSMDLYEVVTKNMIHGPCGTLNPNSPSMIAENTLSDILEHYYPTRLRETMDSFIQKISRRWGKLTTIQMWNGDIEVDNRLAPSGIVAIPLSGEEPFIPL